MSGFDKVGGVLAAHGYNPSIMQEDLTHCYVCGRTGSLDRHEIFHADFGGVQRNRCKCMGLWVMLCHDTCHLDGAHRRKEITLLLKRQGQQRAMDYYDLTVDEFRELFGKNYL